jgi:NAD(P)H-hydrate repair Nnr-like enzyme with NAD(P)H-hydrate epimerase domain
VVSDQWSVKNPELPLTETDHCSLYTVAMHVLSAAEMQACDRVTTERFGVPSIELMRAASGAVAAFARAVSGCKAGDGTLRRGNNGGDGMMAARLLADSGLEVTTLLLGSPDGLTGDAATAWRELTSPAHGLVQIIERRPRSWPGTTARSKLI